MAGEGIAKILLTAKDETAAAFASAKSGLGQVQSIAESLPAKFGAVGVAVAGAFQAASIKDAIDLGDRLDDLSEKTGITVENLSALRYAGEVTGTPLESLATGVRKLSINMAAAAGGSKEQAALFQTLGVSVRELDGSLRGSDQVLGDLADRFASFRDGPEKSALAVQIFGKAGEEMIPVLNQGSAGIARLRGEAEKMGAVFGGDLAKQAADFNDNLKRIELSAEAAKVRVAGKLLPTLNELSDVFLETKAGSESNAEAFGSVLAGGLQKAAVYGNNLVTTFKVAGLGIYSLGARLKSLATLDLDEFDLISRAVKRDSEAAWEEAKSFAERMRLLLNSTAGAGRGGKGTGEFADTRILGSPESIKEQTAAWKGAAPVIKTAGEAAHKAADEFANLYNQITGKDAGIDADFGKKVATLKDGYDKGRISLEQYVEVIGKYAQQQPYAVAATKAATKAAEDRQAALLKESEGIEDWMRTQSAATASSLASVNERIQSLDDEEAASALAASQQISLAEAIELVTISRLREKQNGFITGSDGWKDIEREIEARKDLASMVSSAETRKANAQAAKESADAWVRSLDQVGQSLTDQIMAGGKNGAEYLKNLFRTLTLRPIIQGTVNTGLSMAASALGFSGSASAGTASSTLSAASNLAGVFGGGTSMANLAGTTFANLTGTGLDGLLATNAAFGTAAAEGMGAVMSGLMTAAPYLAAVAAVSAIAKSLDHSGTPHIGAGTSYSAAAGLAQASAGATGGGLFSGITYSDSTQQMTTSLVQSIVGILDTTAVAFGKSAGYQAAASFADDSSKDGAWGSLVISKLGEVVSGWAVWAGHGQVFSDGAAGSAEYLAKVTADVRTALDQISLPGWATKMLDQLGAAPTLEQLSGAVATINATQVALTQIGKSLQGFDSLSDGAVSALLAASGGIEALSSNAASYYGNFYTQEERTANTIAQITEQLSALGLEMPTTRAGFRELTDAQIALGEAGAPAAAKLLSLNAAFASVVPEAAAVTTAVQEVAVVLGRTAEDIAAERAGLETSLLQSLGDTATLRQRELDALDPANRSLQQAIYNLDDVRSAIDSLDAQASSAAGTISTLQASISGWASTARQASDLLNSITAARTGTDNTEATLWASIGIGTLQEQMATAQQLLGIVTASIAADTNAAQAEITQGAQAAQKAVEQLNATQLSAAQAQIENATRLVDLGRQLRDYVQGLRVGNLSTLTPAQKLAEAESLYSRSLAGARAGDTTAMGALQGNASSFLELARAYDPGAYNKVFESVTSTLDSFGGSLQTEGQQAATTASAQLATLKALSSTATVQAEAASISNVISAENAGKLATLQELVSTIQTQAVVAQAADQARLTEAQARADAIAAEQAAAQALLIEVQSSARDALTALPNHLAENNAALIAEIRALNARIEAMEASLVQVGLQQINAQVTASAQNAATVSGAVTGALNKAAGAPVITA